MADEVSCPTNLRWLKGMRAVFPDDVWKASRLARYETCLTE